MSYKIFGWLVLLSVVFCVSCDRYDTFPKERSAGLEEPAALKALIDTGQTVESGDFRIVDVRPEGKYAEGHIPTAMNLPNGNLPTSGAPPRDKFIIVYCETGGRAQMAAKKMGKAGYHHIFNWGGFGNWTYAPEK